MALTWDTKDIVPNEKYPIYIKGVDTGMGGMRLPTPEDKPEAIEEWWHPRLNGLLMAMLVLGTCRITKENWKKFYARVSLYEKLCGDIMYHGPKFSPAEIQAYVGLHTNVSTETDAAFAKKVMRWAQEDANRAIAALESKDEQV